MARTKKNAEIAPEMLQNEKKLQKQPRKTQKSCLKSDEVPEAVVIYHTGDNLEKITEQLTGHKYMEYAVLNYSGYNMNTLKDGAILKWGL